MLDRDDVLQLVGDDVLEVGVRQGWPFLTFGLATPERTEHRLFIDPGFSVADGDGKPLGASGLDGLEPLVGHILAEARVGENEATLQFDNGLTLRVGGFPDPDTEGPPVWRGVRA
jgi:hypothetical protein